ncbi:MAG: hypothetical protein K6343_00135, partial [Caldisericaceae bacterium]
GVNLAISLHSAIQSKRDFLMEGLKHESLTDLKDALLYYINNTKNTVTLEYLLLDDINDKKEDLIALVKFAKMLKNVKVNLIHYNKIDGVNFNESKREIFFEKELLKNEIRATLRLSKGTDVSAACGQLATHITTDPKEYYI